MKIDVPQKKLDLAFFATAVSILVFSLIIRVFIWFTPSESLDVDTLLETKLSEYTRLEPKFTADKLPKDVSLFLEKGQTLSDLLTEEGVGYSKVINLVNTIRPHLNLRRLQEGTQVNVTLVRENPSSPLEVIALSIIKSPKEKLELLRSDDGSYRVRSVEKEFLLEKRFVEGTVQNSLISCMQKNGIPYGVVMQLVNAYSSIVDFQRSIHKGDKFEVLFEEQNDQETGRTMGVTLKYACLYLQKEKIPLYSFDTPDAKRVFYNEKGEAAVKNLLLTPISGARISGRFGMRKHPILGYSRMHKGIDFAAPRGTPIYAAGNGRVEAAGRRGSYGNYIKIRHNGEYCTAYAHLNKIETGIKRGARVEQGQIIGRVGSTGRSSGPHLHYEVIRNGKHINPSQIKSLPSLKLKGGRLKQFMQQVRNIQYQINQERSAQNH